MPIVLDLTGRRFGRLTVIGSSRTTRHQKLEWLCRCDCGNEKWILSNSLCRLRTRSCGCLNRDRLTHGQIVDLSWQRFDRLLVLDDVRRGEHRVEWLCRCDCGAEFWVRANSLKTGRTRSCGCLRTPRSPEEQRLAQNAATARYKLRYPERAKAWDGDWARKNPGKKRAANALRKKKIRRATPPWADLKAIENIYIECPEGHHVHHKIPITVITDEGYPVWGLHIPDNLESITASENLRIHNRVL